MMKMYASILTLTFSFLSLGLIAQTDGFFTRATPTPYWRHSYDAVITPDNNLYSVGGWDFNDAITSAFRSTDEGESWLIYADYVNAPLHAIHFTSSSNAITVGYSGTILKSSDGGLTFDEVTVEGNAGSRDYTDVFFTDDNNGVIVGGNESNDAIQTILKTSDGGNSWEVISDSPAPWLHSVHFVSSDVGFAVGDNGTILKSEDGGSTWTSQTAPGNTSNRSFKSVFFTDANNGLIVGGWAENDSIQTIIKTIDGGENWTLISDNLGSMLLDVYMYSQDEGYAVGDDGIILQTIDSGNNWQTIELLNGVNDAEPLTSVYFKDAFNGVFGGKVGKIIVYDDPTQVTPDAPVIVSVNQASLQVTQSTVNSVYFEATVNGSGQETDVFFDIGLDSTATDEFNPSPNFISDSEDHLITLNESSLLSDQLYYFRVRAENEAGTSVSNFMQVYTGLDIIPNWSFENWDAINSNTLDDWLTFGNVSEVESYNGSSAVRLQGNDDDTPGAMLFGIPGDNGIAGGIPFAERPDSLVGYFDYDIASGDSAVVMLTLKNNEGIVSNNMFHIGGSSGGSFERLSFPVTYLNSSMPDSLILVIISTNFFASGVNESSVLKVDDIEMINSDSQVPNNDIEGWTTTTDLKVQHWYGAEDLYGDPGKTVFQSTESQHGLYSVMLKNDTENPQWQVPLYASLNDDWNAPDFEVFAKHETFNGYYQFSNGVSGNDTLMIRITMFNGDQAIGEGVFVEASDVMTFEPFTIDINYFSNQNPDGAKIQVWLMNNSVGVSEDAYALIDNLSFDGFVLDEVLSVDKSSAVDRKMKVYPNPASDEVTISIQSNTQEFVEISIYNVSGMLIKRIPGINILAGTTTIPVQLSDIPPGIYVVAVNSNNQITSQKLITY